MFLTMHSPPRPFLCIVAFFDMFLSTNISAVATYVGHNTRCSGAMPGRWSLAPSLLVTVI